MYKTFLISISILLSSFIYAQQDSLKLIKTGRDTSLVKPLLSDSSLTKDSLPTAADSLKLKRQKPVIPINQKGFLCSADFGTSINRDQLFFNDYRYTGDLVSQFPTGFLRDLGVLGQPNEALIYGAGFDNITYMQDGIPINNRLTNSLDLNFVQSESIDSIEIIPSVRGFLYGSMMNPVSVNFISKNEFKIDNKKGSYSRLRYYKAPNDEAMIDAIFQPRISQRLIGFFEMTNSAITAPFINSKYGGWKATARLNYLLSDNLNIIGSYNYAKTETHLFGGINTDALYKMTTEVSQDSSYPVMSYTRYQKVTQHNFSLKLLNKQSDNFYGEFNAYYRFNLLEFRQNENRTNDSEAVIFNDHISKTLGGFFRETYNNSFVSADVIANYEKVFLKKDYVSGKQFYNSFSLTGKVSLNSGNNTLIPTIFGRYLYLNGQSYSGFGGDLSFNISPSLSLYGGISYFKKPDNLFAKYLAGPEEFVYRGYYEGNTTNIEAGFKFNNNNISLITNVFHRREKGDKIFFYDSYYDVVNRNLYGISMNLSANIWKIFWESNSAFYYSKYENVYSGRYNYARNYLLPEFTFSGGIYFKDILFNSNLNLKTGISASAVGKQDYYEYDFENSFSLISSGTSSINNPGVKSSIVFNFVLIGEIQKRATIYFTFENLFDKEYYIVPYYKKQGRGMRIGVAWEFLN